MGTHDIRILDSISELFNLKGKIECLPPWYSPISVVKIEVREPGFRQIVFDRICRIMS